MAKNLNVIFLDTMSYLNRYFFKGTFVGYKFLFSDRQKINE